MEGKTLHELQEECNMVIGIIVVLGILGIILCIKNASRYTEEEEYIMATVIKCERGEFHQDQYYQNLATTYLIQKNYALYTVYTMQAEEEGKYDYHITAEAGGMRYVVVRDEPSRMGMTVSIRRVETYKDGELVETRYE